jgi:hypothetical protein
MGPTAPKNSMEEVANEIVGPGSTVTVADLLTPSRVAVTRV